ncbi:MAG: hypothetical protein NG712_04435 [Omnitrophica bacterium]|nr:hypothetical protein [Candidatus Omnitrophota bacterium]
MNDPEKFFREQIQTRWQNWEPTSPQMSDWCNMIKPYRQSDVLQAVRDHVCSRAGSYREPKLMEMRKLLGRHGTGAAAHLRVLHLFGRDTGNFHTVYIDSPGPISDEDLLRKGKGLAWNYGQMYGENYVVYTNKTNREMCEMRHEVFVGKDKR